METTKLKFKTNINCGGCIEKVTPFLNEVVGEGHWTVDTSTKDKMLTVDDGITSADAVMASVQKAGYKIEEVNN